MPLSSRWSHASNLPLWRHKEYVGRMLSWVKLMMRLHLSPALFSLNQM